MPPYFGLIILVLLIVAFILYRRVGKARNRRISPPKK